MINRILTRYTNWFAVWVVLFGVAAYRFPRPFLAMKGGLEWFFALTMFGIGAVLSINDFREIARRPVIVLIGTVAQFTIMPLGAFALAKIFRLPPELAVGLIVTGTAPGAMASNVMSYIAKADTAYSVSLTTVSTLLCVVLTPTLTELLASSYLPVSWISIFRQVMLTVLLPLGLGFGARYVWRERMQRIEKVFPAISVTFIVFICSVLVAANRQQLILMTGVILLVTVLLNLFGMSMGYAVGSTFRMAVQQRRTLSIEIGMQNAGLGATILVAQFGERAAMPAAVFVFVCIFTAAICVRIWGRQSRATAEPVAAEA